MSPSHVILNIMDCCKNFCIFQNFVKKYIDVFFNYFYNFSNLLLSKTFANYD